MRIEAYNTFAARFEVLRNNAVYRTIYAMDESAEVTCDAESALKMSIRGNFFDYSAAGIDFLADRLRPVVVINGVDYPLGIYVITTETKTRADNVSGCGIEGYSLLYLAQRKKIEERLYIAAGANYITEITKLLVSCGISDIESDATDYTFATAREDWDIGTPVLDIVNQLLSEISYNSAWVDLAGTVRLTKYAQPTISAVDHVYSSGEFSMIEDYYEITSDRYEKCNVFRVTCENPELDSPLVAVSVNDSADNPYSTANVGRILYTERVDNTPSLAALQAYADKLKYQSYQTTEKIKFRTAIVPEHAAFDVVALDLGDAAGIYAETEWVLPIMTGGTMEHTARRVIAE